MAEMMQGVLRACPVPEGMTREDMIADLEQFLIFKRDTIHTGADFARCASRLIEKHQPDLVWVDPLLSYVGDDISQQRVASTFLRNTLNPIAMNTGIVWMLLHHTGKPSTDPRARAHWTDHDFSYAAFGSSELVNWARAVNVLEELWQRRLRIPLRETRQAGRLARIPRPARIRRGRERSATKVHQRDLPCSTPRTRSSGSRFPNLESSRIVRRSAEDPASSISNIPQT